MLQVLTFVFLSLFTTANVMALSTPQYKCEVMGHVANMQEFIEERFTTTPDNGSHGGKELSFTNGAQEIVVIANQQWLGISWFYKGEKIAEAVNVIKEKDSSQRVLIVYNPKNPEEQASLNCEK